MKRLRFGSDFDEPAGKPRQLDGLEPEIFDRCPEGLHTHPIEDLQRKELRGQGRIRTSLTNARDLDGTRPRSSTQHPAPEIPAGSTSIDDKEENPL